MGLVEKVDRNGTKRNGRLVYSGGMSRQVPIMRTRFSLSQLSTAFIIPVVAMIETGMNPQRGVRKEETQKLDVMKHTTTRRQELQQSMQTYLCE